MDIYVIYFQALPRMTFWNFYSGIVPSYDKENTYCFKITQKIKFRRKNTVRDNIAYLYANWESPSRSPSNVTEHSFELKRLLEKNNWSSKIAFDITYSKTNQYGMWSLSLTFFSLMFITSVYRITCRLPFFLSFYNLLHNSRLINTQTRWNILISCLNSLSIHLYCDVVGNENDIRFCLIQQQKYTIYKPYDRWSLLKFTEVFQMKYSKVSRSVDRYCKVLKSSLVIHDIWE